MLRWALVNGDDDCPGVEGVGEVVPGGGVGDDVSEAAGGEKDESAGEVVAALQDPIVSTAMTGRRVNLKPMVSSDS